MQIHFLNSMKHNIYQNYIYSVLTLPKLDPSVFRGVEASRYGLLPLAGAPELIIIVLSRRGFLLRQRYWTFGFFKDTGPRLRTQCPVKCYKLSHISKIYQHKSNLARDFRPAHSCLVLFSAVCYRRAHSIEYHRDRSFRFCLFFFSVKNIRPLPFQGTRFVHIFWSPLLGSFFAWQGLHWTLDLMTSKTRSHIPAGFCSGVRPQLFGTMRLGLFSKDKSSTFIALLGNNLGISPENVNWTHVFFENHFLFTKDENGFS